MLPSLGERDLFRAFQLLPGVSGSNEASSGLYVRGGTPDQNRVEYDGFRVYHVDHLFGYFSAFNMDAVDTVELSKGGFEARHGGVLSSVMPITLGVGHTFEGGVVVTGNRLSYSLQSGQGQGVEVIEDEIIENDIQLMGRTVNAAVTLKF